MLGEFSSGLSEIISPRTAGSLPIQPVPRHSGAGGGVSAGPTGPRSKPRLSLTQLDPRGGGRKERERERERERETGRERERLRDGA